MKRFLMTVAVLVLTGMTATAGPIRDRIAARFHRPACGSCQPTAAPAPGPVQQVAGNVIQATGQVVQSVGQAVSQMPTFRPSNCPTCVGGVCK